MFILKGQSIGWKPLLNPAFLLYSDPMFVKHTNKQASPDYFMKWSECLVPSTRCRQRIKVVFLGINFSYIKLVWLNLPEVGRANTFNFILNSLSQSRWMKTCINQGTELIGGYAFRFWASLIIEISSEIIFLKNWPDNYKMSSLNWHYQVLH